MATARVIDHNKFITIARNPISRVGVFKYRESQVKTGGDPGKMVNVYRPASTLSDPAVIKSMENLPFIDEHTWLGPAKDGHTPAEKKGIHGITGADVAFDGGVLYSDIKIFSDTLADNIQKGKKGVSLGYKCKYDHAPGTFDGQDYDWVQRDMRGNHLALCKNPRSDVNVLDDEDSEFQSAYDHIEFSQKKEPDEMNKEEIAKLVADSVKTAMDARDEADKVAKDAKDKADKEKADKEAADKKAADEKAAKDKEAEDAKKGKTMDAAEVQTALDAKDEKIKTLEDRLNKIEQNSGKIAMDSIAKRDVLYTSVAPFTGSFEHQAMDEAGVAQYAAKKFGLTVDPGTEVLAVKSYLHGRTPDSQKPTVKVALDSEGKPKKSQVASFTDANQ